MVGQPHCLQGTSRLDEVVLRFAQGGFDERGFRRVDLFFQELPQLNATAATKRLSRTALDTAGRTLLP